MADGVSDPDVESLAAFLGALRSSGDEGHDVFDQLEVFDQQVTARASSASAMLAPTLAAPANPFAWEQWEKITAMNEEFMEEHDEYGFVVSLLIGPVTSDMLPAGLCGTRVQELLTSIAPLLAKAEVHRSDLQEILPRCVHATRALLMVARFHIAIAPYLVRAWYHNSHHVWSE